MSNTDGLPTVSDRLKKLFGGTDDRDAQLRAVFRYLKADGSAYQRTVKEQKAEKMAFLVEFAKELDQARLLQVACDALRKRLKRHNGTGERRRHSRQNFYAMAFEVFYGARRNTASQAAKVIGVLLKEKVAPENFSKEVKKRGLEGIAPTKKKVKAASAANTKPTHKRTSATAKVSTFRGPKSSKEDHDETEFRLSFAADVLKGCAALPEGELFVIASLVKTESGGSITATAPVEQDTGLWMMLAQQVYTNRLEVAGRFPDKLLDKVLLHMPKKRIAA